MLSGCILGVCICVCVGGGGGGGGEGGLRPNKLHRVLIILSNTIHSEIQEGVMTLVVT